MRHKARPTNVPTGMIGDSAGNPNKFIDLFKLNYLYSTIQPTRGWNQSAVHNKSKINLKITTMRKHTTTFKLTKSQTVILSFKTRFRHGRCWGPPNVKGHLFQSFGATTEEVKRNESADPKCFAGIESSWCLLNWVSLKAWCLQLLRLTEKLVAVSRNALIAVITSYVRADLPFSIFSKLKKLCMFRKLRQWITLFIRVTSLYKNPPRICPAVHHAPHASTAFRIYF